MAGKGEGKTEHYEHDTGGMHRRGFLGRSGFAAAGLVAGGALPFAKKCPVDCCRLHSLQARWHNHRKVRLPSPKDLST